jgi:hypothetical protein
MFERKRLYDAERLASETLTAVAEARRELESSLEEFWRG